MPSKKYWKERDKIALELGLLCLGFYDFGLPYEKRGEKVPQDNFMAFKRHYDTCLGRYAELIKTETKTK